MSAGSTVAEVRYLPVEQLVPNDYNPNRMSDSGFRQLVAEVMHLGRIPKPVVVRPKGDRFEITDGEHNWRAGMEAGLIEIPCEISEMGDFEAMRQTYKRNQHGEHDRVRLGQMFRRMMQEGNLSCRALAKEICIAEGTVRNNLQYAEAAEVRNGYARDTSHTDIARLKVQQVRRYLDLNEEVRDIWLDAGADLYLLGDRSICQPLTWWDVFDPIVEAGLADLLKPDCLGFWPSVKALRELAQWASGPVLPYVRAVAELGMDAFFLEFLPFATGDARRCPMLTPERWRSLLEDCYRRASNARDRLSLVRCSVEVALKDAGVDPSEVYGPEYVWRLQQLESAPEFIRLANHLTIEEQVELMELMGPSPVEPILDAAKFVCEQFCRRRGGDSEVSDDQSQDRAAGTIASHFAAALDRIIVDQQDCQESVLLAQRDLLHHAVVEKLVADCGFGGADVGGESARHTLDARLHAIPWPEFQLLAGFLLCDNRDERLAMRWAASVAAENNAGGDAT